MLNLMHGFVEEHGFSCNAVALNGSSPSAEIIKYATETSADLLVAGAHAVSAMKRIAFGSTTAGLLANCSVPIFLDN